MQNSNKYLVFLNTYCEVQNRFKISIGPSGIFLSDSIMVILQIKNFKLNFNLQNEKYDNSIRKHDIHFHRNKLDICSTLTTSADIFAPV